MKKRLVTIVHPKTQLVNQLAAPFVYITKMINKRQILFVSILLLLVLGSVVVAEVYTAEGDPYQYRYNSDHWEADDTRISGESWVRISASATITELNRRYRPSTPVSSTDDNLLDIADTASDDSEPYNPTNINQIVHGDVKVNINTGNMFVDVHDEGDTSVPHKIYRIDPSTGILTPVYPDDEGVALNRFTAQEGEAGKIKDGKYVARGEDEAFGSTSLAATSVKALRSTSENAPKRTQLTTEINGLNADLTRTKSFAISGVDALKLDIPSGAYTFGEDNNHLTGPDGIVYVRTDENSWAKEDCTLFCSMPTEVSRQFEIARQPRERDGRLLAEKTTELAALDVVATPAPATAAPLEPTRYEVTDVLKDLANGKITHFEASERLDVLAAQAAPEGSKVSIGGVSVIKVGNDWKELGDDGKTPKSGGRTFSNDALQTVDRTGKDISSLVFPDTSKPTRVQLDGAGEGSTVVVDGVKATKDGDIWIDSEGDEVGLDKDVDALITAGKVQNLETPEAKEAKERQKQANRAFYQSTWFESIKLHGNFYSDTLRKYGDVGGAFFQGLARLGEYQALSNALMPETTQAWLKAADNEFLNTWADVPGRITAEACEIDDLKQSERAGQNAIFVRTASGVDQPVGSIFAEVSPSTSPILCERNTDEEAEEEFICYDGMVCKDNTFCYESEDDEQPAQGYFYKITWGVSAPADAKFTPNIDEDGKAIKLNLALYGSGAPLWLYESDTTTGDSVIELSNGDSYTETITHFAPKDLTFTKACIVFNSQYRIKDFEGDEIPEICATFELSKQGEVEFAKSDRSSPSVTPATGEVRRSRNWRRS